MGGQVLGHFSQHASVKQLCFGLCQGHIASWGQGGCHRTKLKHTRLSNTWVCPGSWQWGDGNGGLSLGIQLHWDEGEQD